MKAQLINLGRSQINKVVEVKGRKELHKEIQRHLVSKGWYMDEVYELGTWVIYVGYRQVGKVKILEQ